MSLFHAFNLSFIKNNSNVGKVATSDFIPGRYLVKLTEVEEVGSEASLVKKANAKTKETGWVSIDIKNKAEYEKLKKQQNISQLYKEPKRYLMAPNDSYYTGQNNVINGQFDQWNLRKIGLNPTTVTSAWNTTKGDENTIVAVIDTGVALSNPDIGGGSGSSWSENNLWINQEEITGAIRTAMDVNTNGEVDSVEMINYFRTNNLDVNSDGAINFLDTVSTGSPLLNNTDNNSPTNGYPDDIFGYDFAAADANPNDIDGHGTHVYGIIGATTDNNSTVNPGVAGVCWYCKVMPLRVINDFGFGFDSDIANAITYAVENGAKVVNLSLGGEGYSQVLDDAIVNAWDNGVLVVSASGNYGPSASDSYPGGSEKSFAVASTDVFDTIASYSNIGVRLDISAPGDYVLSTYKLSTDGCIGAGYYVCSSGTSMASPHVAGVAALLFSQNPSWQPRDVRYALLTGTTDIYGAGFDNTSGYGRLNAISALSKSAIANDSTQPVASLTPFSPSLVGGTIAINGTASDANLYLYTISFARTSDNYIVKQVSGRTSTTNGTLYNFDTSLIPGDTYNVTLRVEDFYGNAVTSSAIQIETDGEPPTSFSLINPSNPTYTQNPRPTFSWQAATDPNGVEYDLTVGATLLADDISVTNFTPGSDIADGAYSWYVSATDSLGNSRNSEDDFVLVIDRVAPNNFSINTTINGITPTFSFSATDDLSGINNYQVSIDGGSFTNASSPYTTGAQSQGDHTVTVRAIDRAGNTREVSANFTISNLCLVRKIKADFNCDGVVNISDLSILASNWQKAATAADANGDNTVNISDLSILASNWQKSV